MRSAPLVIFAVLLSLAGLAYGLAGLPHQTVWSHGLTLTLGRGQSSVRSAMEWDGLPQLYHLDDRVFSGGKPAGPVGFQSLADLGVRTVISVDGEEPDVDAAEAVGLKYVHLPIGYDGIPRTRIVELVIALQQLPGPVYIHCHRGLHRGPAAAVAACRAAGLLHVAGESVDELLQEMGTAPKYAALYRDAREARPLSVKERRSVDARQLPSRTAVAPLVRQMVDFEHAWEHWGHALTTESEWTPELVTGATGLAERLFEAGRLLEETPDNAALRAALIADSRWLSESVESRVDSPDSLAKLLHQRCDVCHTRFRDQ